MKIIIKPLGAAVLLGAILLLAVLAFRGKTDRDSAMESSALQSVIVTNTTPSDITSSSPVTPPSPPADTMSSPVAVRGHSIYRDGVENGWQTEGWTWAKEVAFADTRLVRSGTKAIRVRYSGFDGVKFHHAPLDTSPFDRISFYVSGGASGGQRIAVGAACSEKNVADGVKLAALPPIKWVAVTIPLTQIGLANRPDMTSFWIQGGTNTPQPEIFIDEVRLLTPGEPAPSGEKLPLSL